MISDNWFHKGKITYTFFLLFALFLLSNECLSSLFEKFCLKLNDSLSLNIRMCFPMLAAALIADEYFSFLSPCIGLELLTFCLSPQMFELVLNNLLESNGSKDVSQRTKKSIIRLTNSNDVYWNVWPPLRHWSTQISSPHN